MILFIICRKYLIYTILLDITIGKGVKIEILLTRTNQCINEMYSIKSQ